MALFLYLFEGCFHFILSNIENQISAFVIIPWKR